MSETAVQPKSKQQQSPNHIEFIANLPLTELYARLETFSKVVFLRACPTDLLLTSARTQEKLIQQNLQAREARTPLKHNLMTWRTSLIFRRCFLEHLISEREYQERYLRKRPPTSRHLYYGAKLVGKNSRKYDFYGEAHFHSEENKQAIDFQDAKQKEESVAQSKGPNVNFPSNESIEKEASFLRIKLGSIRPCQGVTGSSQISEKISGSTRENFSLKKVNSNIDPHQLFQYLSLSQNIDIFLSEFTSQELFEQAQSRSSSQLQVEKMSVFEMGRHSARLGLLSMQEEHLLDFGEATDLLHLKQSLLKRLSQTETLIPVSAIVIPNSAQQVIIQNGNRSGSESSSESQSGSQSDEECAEFQESFIMCSASKFQKEALNAENYSQENFLNLKKKWDDSEIQLKREDQIEVRESKIAAIKRKRRRKQAEERKQRFKRRRIRSLMHLQLEDSSVEEDQSEERQGF